MERTPRPLSRQEIWGGVAGRTFFLCYKNKDSVGQDPRDPAFILLSLIGGIAGIPPYFSRKVNYQVNH